MSTVHGVGRALDGVFGLLNTHIFCFSTNSRQSCSITYSSVHPQEPRRMPAALFPSSELSNNCHESNHSQTPAVVNPPRIAQDQILTPCLDLTPSRSHSVVLIVALSCTCCCLGDLPVP